MTSRQIEWVAQYVGRDSLLTEKEDLLAYAFDGTPMLKEVPDCVVFPDGTDQVAEILKFANSEKIPVVTRGAGTGLSGGSVPVKGSLVVCTVRMNKILRIEPNNLTAWVEPGVNTARFDEAIQPYGLFYPPDPGSMKISTLGGNVSTNAGGLRGLKYGVTKDYVMGLETVLPTGEILKTGTSCIKDVAGYSLKDLFIGAEGTLGIITKILLRLIPRPKSRKTLLATFASMEAAAKTASDIIAEHIILCTLEFLDQTTIQCVEEYVKIGMPQNIQALLLMETDGHPVMTEEEAVRLQDIAQKNGALEVKTARDSEEAVRLASARRVAFSALARVAPTTILEDVTVPRNRLVEMVRFIQETAQKRNLRTGIFGHMGDGNLHPTFLTDERKTEEIHQVEEAFKEIFEKAVAMGGTITGEHGVGLAKKKFLPLVVDSPGLRIHRELKKIFDPNGILNPGKMF